MHGNVWEWTSTAEGSSRVLRGGDWSAYTKYCESAARGRGVPDNRAYFIGVRLVRSSDDEEESKEYYQQIVKVRCQNCKRLINITSSERPITVTCPNCGAKGMLE